MLMCLSNCQKKQYKLVFYLKKEKKKAFRQKWCLFWLKALVKCRKWANANYLEKCALGYLENKFPAITLNPKTARLWSIAMIHAQPWNGSVTYFHEELLVCYTKPKRPKFRNAGCLVVKEVMCFSCTSGSGWAAGFGLSSLGFPADWPKRMSELLSTSSWTGR